MTDNFVRSYTHLKDRPNADKALHMLQRVASLVKPIMRKRSWVLPELAEFFPDNPNLLGLNVNMGQKILVRLRPAHSPDSFLPEEDVIGTMLHELTHNVHGPHDEKFYKYLSGLQDEYDALQRSGYAGEGFFSEGKRLGTNISHNVPPYIARQKALEAVEKRMKTSRVLGSGGKLGGLRRTAGLTPRELAARAAEQRIRDEKSCAFGADAIREADKAAKGSNTVKTTAIDLTSNDNAVHDPGSDSDSDVVIIKDVHSVKPVKSGNALAGPSKKNSQRSPRISGKPSNINPGGSSQIVLANNQKQQSHSGSMKETRVVPSAKTGGDWQCTICTLINVATSLQCDACTTRRPVDDNEGWSCLVCGETRNPHQHWSCRYCGQVKLHS